jgi:hypothetical protein
MRSHKRLKGALRIVLEPIRRERSRLVVLQQTRAGGDSPLVLLEPIWDRRIVPSSRTGTNWGGGGGLTKTRKIKIGKRRREYVSQRNIDKRY